MPLRVLIAPDKFKGTLSAREAAQAIAAGWSKARPMDHLELLPMCDGGDGFGEVMASLLSAEVQTTKTVDAAHRPIHARWWWSAKQRTAIIESAEVVGLARVQGLKSIRLRQGFGGQEVQSPKSKVRTRWIHPFELDTFGLGLLLRSAADKGASRCLVGIGGSATNDGGFGLARALGCRFLDKSGRTIEKWTELEKLESVLPPAGSSRANEARIQRTRLRQQWSVFSGQWSVVSPEDLVVAVDVGNPLLGPNGATRVYGPQKGLPPKDFPLAEACLERLAAIVQSRQARGRSPRSTVHGPQSEIVTADKVEDKVEDKVKVAEIPGAGAAGGLGFGLMAFAGARLERGFELFAQHAKLDTRLRQADLVITGEGAIDRSTFMGKGVGEIARRCAELDIPCIGFSGRREKLIRLNKLTELTKENQLVFRVVASLEEITTAKRAREQAGFWLQQLAEHVANRVKSL